MAARTADGSAAPLAQEDAAEAAIPAWSSRNRRASASTSGKHRWQSPAARSDRSPSGDARLDRVGDRGEHAVGQPVAKGGDPGDVVGSAGGGEAGGGRHGGDARDVLGAAAALPLLSATDLAGGQGHTGPDHQRADALGPSELVGADRDQVGVGGGLGDVDPRQGLDGVGVEDGVGRVAADDLGHGGERLDGPHLVVDQHDRHQGDTVQVVEQGGEGVQVDPPGRVDGGDVGPEAERRVPDGGVLDRRDDHDVPPAAAPSTARLSASVPPPVNTTSPGPAPSTSASTSRASSSTRRAARAAAWEPDGLPGSSVRTRVSSATASGRTGIDAAQSR